MNELIKRIKDCILEDLPFVDSIEQIGDTTDLASLGMDSMLATNILINIEDEFDVMFTEDMLEAETFMSAESLSFAISRLLEKNSVV